jgi:glycosyltransferase involved in cell wall biosynthesis
MTSAAKRRTVFVIDDLGLGGAQRQLVEILKRFPKDRYETTVLSLSAKKADYAAAFGEAGIPLRVIDHAGKWSFRTLAAVRAVLRELRPEVVYTWLFTAEMYGRVAAVLEKVPCIVSAMRNTIDDMPWHYRWVSRALSMKTDRITVNVRAIAPGLTRVWKIPPSKITVIYNGIDLREFPLLKEGDAVRTEIGIPPGSRVAGMVARMAPQKDHATLVAAAAAVIREAPETYFVLAGDGPLRRQIEGTVKNTGLADRFRFLGPRRDAWRLMNAFDVCVLSTHFEGCSNVVMEGMAAAKPVIATDVGGNAELVADGVTGFTVPHEDAFELARRLLELVRDPMKAQAMGAAGRRRVEDEFTIERTVEKTVALFDELLAPAGRT